MIQQADDLLDVTVSYRGWSGEPLLPLKRYPEPVVHGPEAVTSERMPSTPSVSRKSLFSDTQDPESEP